MRSLWVSFRKNFTSHGFYICLIMTIILLFSAEVYTDFTTQSRYSVFRLIVEFDRGYFLNNEMLCADYIAQNARGGWLGMFLPIITAFCFVPQICTERSAHAFRFEIFRTSKLGFDLSQFFAGILSSGISVTLGYSIFFAVVSGIYPAASEYAFEISSLNLPLTVLGVFLYGAFWSIPAMFLTSVLNNKYVIMCIPFFVKYGLAQTYSKLLSDVYSDYENHNLKFAEFLTITDPQALLFSANNPNYWKTAMFYGIVFIIFLTAYLFINRRRSDCGA